MSSQVLCMVNSISLGSYFFKIAFIMREAILVNSIMTNSEVWYEVTAKQMDVLEDINLGLIKNFLAGHSKTAKEAFYLETGTLPLRYTLAKRRLMYLWTILQRDDSDMLKRAYMAQKISTTKGDWSKTIEKEKELFNINLNEDEIAKLSKHKFKKIVSEAVENKALETLNDQAEKHSKSKSLICKKLIRKEYFDTKDLNKAEIQLLFALRTRTTQVKNNFKTMYNGDLLCKACNEEEETQEHLMRCKVISENTFIPDNLEYEDIFGTVEQQIRITKIFKELFREKEIF